MNPQPKQRPRALVKADRTKREDALYRKNSKLARNRDGNRCRICGGRLGMTTHHVERRSHFGVKQIEAKHAVSNLMACCVACHQLFTDNVLKSVSTTTKGTDGPVLITKWDDGTRDYITFKEKV